MRHSSPGPKFVLRGHAAEVQALCFHPTHHLLFSGDASGNVRLWDLISHRPQRSFSLHTPDAGIMALHFLTTGNSNQLISQGRDGSVKCWELDEQSFPVEKPKLVLQTFSYNFCRCVMFPVELWPPTPLNHPDCGSTAKGEGASKEYLTVIAMSGHEPADVELWGLERGKLVRTLSQPEGMKCGMCMSLAFSRLRDACLLLAGYEDGTLALWDVAQIHSPLTTCKPHIEPIMALAAFNNDVYSTSASNMLHKSVLDLDALQIVAKKQQEFKEPGVSDLAIRADGRIVVTAGWDKKLRIFSTKTCKPLAVLQYHTASIAAVAFDANTGMLVSGSRDTTLAFWDVFNER